ncbi:hypothetical protein D3C87_1348660 [compost metagenome]
MAMPIEIGNMAQDRAPRLMRRPLLPARMAMKSPKAGKTARNAPQARVLAWAFSRAEDLGVVSVHAELMNRDMPPIPAKAHGKR